MTWPSQWRPLKGLSDAMHVIEMLQILDYLPPTLSDYPKVCNRTGSDIFAPLVEIWQTLQSSPETLIEWYETRWNAMMKGDKKEEYERIKASYNSNPNGADMLFLCRSCYGGVVRFRKRDGHMSTPCGIHTPIHPDAFARRAQEWQRRTSCTDFRLKDYEEIMESAESGDLIYCDPPYTYSQSILYGAQSFDLQNLLRVIQKCKSRNVYVALSIDGSKRSGDFICDLPIPTGLFEREVFVNIGKSMLKRFQMEGKSMEGEEVSDRLLLTY
jgi:DNA adenine methylase